MQPVRIQPDAHGVLGAELLHVGHAVDALNLVQHPRGEQVAELKGVHAAIRGLQCQDDDVAVGGLLHAQAQRVDLRGQAWRGQ